MALVRRGDRFRITDDVESYVSLVGYAPSHSFGVTSVVPAGTVIVAFDQVRGASAFGCYPEDYDRMEQVLVPEEEREHFGYAGYYALSFPVTAIGSLLEPLTPLDPRPPNRLPRVTGRPSAPQRAELARHSALHARLDAVEYGSIAKVTERAWVRRNRGKQRHSDYVTPHGTMVPLGSWDIWFDRAPGDPPREPDVVQPGSSSPFGATGAIWSHPAAGGR